jgi:ribonucleoside-diphosphate reductase beta chain
MRRNGYQTMARGFDMGSFPMRLYEKAKRHGTWNPSDLDFTADKEHWDALSAVEQKSLLFFISQFVAGEEAVTTDIVPLITTVANEGRLEEELFLTTFLFDEGKHTQFFRRWLDDVAGSPERLELFHLSNWQRVFNEELPDVMHGLLEDSSPDAVARAAVTYNVVLEGVMAETAYWASHKGLVSRGLMPGLTSGLMNIRRDESRHIAYGVYLVSRVVAEKPSAWQAVEDRMRELSPLVIKGIREGFRLMRGSVTPFGTEEAEVVAHAEAQLAKRYDRIRRGCERSVAEIESEPEPEDVSALVDRDAVGAVD